MSSKGTPIGKLVVRLVGVAFGLGIALLLFAAVASGHSYHASQASHASVAHVTQHRADGWGGGWGGRYMFYGNRFYRPFFYGRFYQPFFYGRMFNFCSCGCY